MRLRTHTDPEQLKKVAERRYTPEYYKDSDDGDHRLENIHLCVRQIAAG